MSVEVSPEEKQQIEGQGWTTVDGVDPERIFIATGTGFRLGHRADGACVFLNPGGGCRIHERFGAPAKPLACRMFPFAIHPAGDRLALSLRFCCPSVAANHGRPLSAHRDVIQQLSQEVVPASYRSGQPPEWVHAGRLTWPGFRRCVEWLDGAVAHPSLPMALKLYRVFACVRALETARSNRLATPDPVQLLGMLSRQVAEKIPSMPEPVERPTRFGHLMFRILLFEYSRTQTVSRKRRSELGPLRTLASLSRFMRAKGPLPGLRPEWGEICFEAVEKPFGALTTEAEATLTRFFRVKIQGLHFCGPAQDGAGFVQGVYGLVLLFPVVRWLSRSLAAGRGRTHTLAEDVTHAVMIVDHHYGYSKRLSSYPFRRIVRLLGQRQDVGRLCCWYGQ